MAYQDRGMMKWQGFVLSEHNEDMSYHNRKKTVPIFLDEQSLELFNEMLLLSHKNQSTIKIEYAYTHDPYESVKHAIGYVWKYDAIIKGIHLKHIDGTKGEFIPITEIRSISEVDSYGI
ncbi:YolD-like family protein [Bacillus sp. JJ722]|uniref:YolD-like family protein n=1 Tax=Bacillus sp. JJ722 TaxID=3122973 RepID=UPI0030008470